MSSSLDRKQKRAEFGAFADRIHNWAGGFSSKVELLFQTDYPSYNSFRWARTNQMTFEGESAMKPTLLIPDLKILFDHWTQGVDPGENSSKMMQKSKHPEVCLPERGGILQPIPKRRKTPSNEAYWRRTVPSVLMAICIVRESAHSYILVNLGASAELAVPSMT